MNIGEERKAKEAERHRKLRVKKKNELLKLRCLHQFLCDNHKPILDEFETGYYEGENEYAPPEQTTTTQTANSSSQTETEYNIFVDITTADLSWLPQPEDMGHLFARLVNGAE